MPLNVGSVILCQNWPSVLVCAASSANLIRGVCTTAISVSEPVSRCGALDYTAHAASVNAPRPRLRRGRLQAGVQTTYGPGFQPGQNNYQAALAALSAILGYPGEQNFQLAEPTEEIAAPAPDAQPLISQALGQRPGAAALQFQGEG